MISIQSPNFLIKVYHNTVNHPSLDMRDKICHHFHYLVVILTLSSTQQSKDFSTQAKTAVTSSSKWARGLFGSQWIRSAHDLRRQVLYTPCGQSHNRCPAKCLIKPLCTEGAMCKCLCVWDCVLGTALREFEMNTSPPARERPCQLLLSPETEPWSWAVRQGSQWRLQQAMAQSRCKWHMGCDTPCIKRILFVFIYYITSS